MLSRLERTWRAVWLFYAIMHQDKCLQEMKEFLKEKRVMPEKSARKAVEEQNLEGDHCHPHQAHKKPKTEEKPKADTKPEEKSQPAPKESGQFKSPLPAKLETKDTTGAEEPDTGSTAGPEEFRIDDDHFEWSSRAKILKESLD